VDRPFVGIEGNEAMKRGVLFILLLGLGAVLGGVVYAALRPERTDDERKLGWLATELDLTKDQQVKIKVLHERYCPEICRLGMKCGGNAPEASRRCRNATKELVQAVAAELTAVQRTRYLEMVACCVDESAGAAPRP
jgi:hypothetical protein